VSRKLQKKRRDGEHTPTMELPERLKQHGDHADSEEEVLRPQGYGGGLFMNMNQSIFGLIAAAGSQADFADQIEGHSSDEEEADDAMAKTIAVHKGSRPERSAAHALAKTTVLSKHDDSHVKAHSRHRKKLSESRLLRSVSGLARFTDKIRSHKSSKARPEEAPQDDDAIQPASPHPSDLAPSIEVTRTESRTKPAVSRMQKAGTLSGSDRKAFADEPLNAEPEGHGSTELAQKLKEIFEFDREEEVIEEYPCWLLQHVLLEGHMYITARHIAFYAYLPKKAVSALESLGSCGALVVLTWHRTRSPRRAIYPSVASGTPSTTATGSSSRATCCRTMSTPRTSTSPTARLT
jgi:sterol 3beta-glucosyltransferase